MKNLKLIITVSLASVALCGSMLAVADPCPGADALSITNMTQGTLTVLSQQTIGTNVWCKSDSGGCYNLSSTNSQIVCYKKGSSTGQLKISYGSGTTYKTGIEVDGKGGGAYAKKTNMNMTQQGCPGPNWGASTHFCIKSD